MRTLDEVNSELSEVRQKHKDLLAERRQILASLPRPNASETSYFWSVPVVSVIENRPGATRGDIMADLYEQDFDIPRRQLTNCLTTLRRRGWIENRGTRKDPKWFVKRT